MTKNDFDLWEARAMWAQWRGCESKRRYDERPDDNLRFKHYQCRYCGGWHATKKTGFPRMQLIGGRWRKPEEVSHD